MRSWDRPRSIERILGSAGRGDFTRENAIELREYISHLEKIIMALGSEDDDPALTVSLHPEYLDNPGDYGGGKQRRYVSEWEWIEPPKEAS